MSVIQLDKAVQATHQSLLSQFSHLLGKSDSLDIYVADQLGLWQTEVAKTLQTEYPYTPYDKKLEEWAPILESERLTEGDLGKAINDFMSFCTAAKLPANAPFWKGVIRDGTTDRNQPKGSTDDLAISGRLLLSEWKKAMDQVRSQWELETLEMLRAKFLHGLQQALSQLDMLQHHLEMLGFDPGLLLDLSKGNLTAQDIELFKRWAQHLEEDEGVRSICELLGKVQQIELSEKIERVRVQKTRQIQIPNINSREEIIGIRLGRDLEHVLPSEKALLADEDTAILFDLKFVESRLMCFDMQGMQTLHETFETEEEHRVEEEEKQGPMVICVDTSGSMKGIPETIAKAVTLYISNKAREQKRPCYLINFSTGLETLELSDDMGMASLMDFLKMSFHGGTDVAPAMEHALEVMERDEYEKADLLIISDFIMADLPESMLESISSQRSKGNRFYSLVVGCSFLSNRLETLFDHEWVYDPHSSRIMELVGFQSQLFVDRQPDANP